ncbi:hypothetical protein M8J75_009658 [Diaphorina citri]|nr:hypothetical protein M8J75_009658 [Diaphorina citri]
MGISKLNSTSNTLEVIFRDLGITEKSIDGDLAILKEWYDKQPHLPPIPAEFENEIKLWIQHLLIATKNSIERVKTSIENYMYARTDFPQLFDDQLIKASMYKDFYNAVTVITFPHLTPDHRMVFYWSFNSSDPFRVVLDYHIKHATEFFGFHSILDLANFKLGHLSQVDLLQVRKIMNYADKAYPLRISNLHVINPPTFMEYGYNVIKPFLSKKIMSRVLVHKSVKDLQDVIPGDILPTQLGGTGGDLEQMKNEWNKRVESSTRLLDSDVFVVDKSLKLNDGTNRVGGSHLTNEDFGQNGTFRKLCVD